MEEEIEQDVIEENEIDKIDVEQTLEEEVAQVKRGRGRPKKIAVEEPEEEEIDLFDLSCNFGSAGDGNGIFLGESQSGKSHRHPS